MYIPDLLAIASFYKDWAGHGRGVGNYLAFGEYPEDDAAKPTLFLPQGIIRGRDISKVEPFDPTKVAEYITHSWYAYQGGDDKSLHPFQGETAPNYTGPTPPYERLDTDKKYSWLKSPRYGDEPMEVGPLARMLVAYVSGHARVKALVDAVLQKLGVGPEALFSTLGRVAARGIETQVLAEKMDDWVDALAANMASGELRIHDNSKWEPSIVARRRDGRRPPRGAARGAEPLGAHPERAHRQLSVRGAEHVERRPPRRERTPRSVRRRAHRHAGGRSRSGRSKSFGPCIRSTRAWRVAFTWSTPRGASWRA